MPASAVRTLQRDISGLDFVVVFRRYERQYWRSKPALAATNRLSAGNG